jgi:hypothetical protein
MLLRLAARCMALHVPPTKYMTKTKIPQQPPRQRRVNWPLQPVRACCQSPPARPLGRELDGTLGGLTTYSVVIRQGMAHVWHALCQGIWNLQIWNALPGMPSMSYPRSCGPPIGLGPATRTHWASGRFPCSFGCRQTDVAGAVEAATGHTSARSRSDRPGLELPCPPQPGLH